MKKTNWAVAGYSGIDAVCRQVNAFFRGVNPIVIEYSDFGGRICCNIIHLGQNNWRQGALHRFCQQHLILMKLLMHIRVNRIQLNLALVNNRLDVPASD